MSQEPPKCYIPACLAQHHFGFLLQPAPRQRQVKLDLYSQENHKLCDQNQRLSLCRLAILSGMDATVEDPQTLPHYLLLLQTLLLKRQSHPQPSQRFRPHQVLLMPWRAVAAFLLVLTLELYRLICSIHLHCHQAYRLHQLTGNRYHTHQASLLTRQVLNMKCQIIFLLTQVMEMH